ncbi:MAG: JAB domain-containing protein [Bacteroidia bacterium]|nr:JAB domain-containing protein [Bacteroidia bacterium]
MIYKIPIVKLSFVNELPSTERKKIVRSSEAEEILRQVYEPGTIEHKEFFFVMYLNRASHFLGVQKVSEGGISSTVVDVRIILQGAILSNASSLILCHNHPSGTLEPSPQDLSLTKNLVDAGKAIGINIADHIILNESDYLSFADTGRMP